MQLTVESLDSPVGCEAGVEGMNPAIFGQKNIKTRLFWLHKQTSPTSVRLNK